MQKKTLLLLTFIISIGLLSSYVAFAAQTGGDDSSKALFDSVKSAMSWAIGIAIGLAAIMFTYGAVRYMFFADGEGKDAMFQSIIGLVLALASFLIIQRINPTLINPLNLQALPTTGNVFLKKANGNLDEVGLYFETNLAMITKNKYAGIHYDCGKLDPKTTPRLIISHKTKNSTSPFFTRMQIECGQDFLFQWVTGDSIIYSLAFEYPGAYFYTSSNADGCVGQYTGPWKDSISNFQDPLTNNVKCMIFYTGEGPNKRFVVLPSQTPSILNGDNSFKPGPPCGGYYSDLEEERTPIKVDGCENSIKSALIFHQPDNSDTAGNEISFYSEPFGWEDTQKNKVGEFKITFKDFEGVQNDLSLDPANMKFQYVHPDPTDPYQQKCKTFKDCHGSIKITGDYLVGLESRTNDKSRLWTQDTTQDINDLSQQQAFPAGYPDFYQVIMLPIVR